MAALGESGIHREGGTRHMGCLRCAVGYHFECPSNIDPCCCEQTIDIVGSPVLSERGRPKLPVDQITDVKSTGRKEAAVRFPIEKGMPCEWRLLKHAGGGVKPIIGCINGIAQARHHGPDKNTLNNSTDNVHRICHKCHNRWHAANDVYYPSERPTGGTPYLPVGKEYLPHDSSTKVNPLETIPGFDKN